MIWEYKTILDFHLPTGEGRLNELGAEGWELVTSEPNLPSWSMIFKRPVRPTTTYDLDHEALVEYAKRYQEVQRENADARKAKAE